MSRPIFVSRNGVGSPTSGRCPHPDFGKTGFTTISVGNFGSTPFCSALDVALDGLDLILFRQGGADLEDPLALRKV